MDELVDRVYKIEKSVFADAYTKKMIEDSISSKYDTINIIEDFAYILYRKLGSEAELMRIAVLPMYRGKTYAIKLMQDMLNDLKENSISECFLEVRKSNESAINLYKKFGFEEVGLRKAYYDKPVEDALLMKLELERN